MDVEVDVEVEEDEMDFLPEDFGEEDDAVASSE